MKLEHSKLVKQLNCQIRNALFPLKVTEILIYSLKKSCPELIIPRGNSLLLNIFVDVFLKQRKKTIIFQTCFVWLILGETHLFHQESPISSRSKKTKGQQYYPSDTSDSFQWFFLWTCFLYFSYDISFIHSVIPMGCGSDIRVETIGSDASSNDQNDIITTNDERNYPCPLILHQWKRELKQLSVIL